MAITITPENFEEVVLKADKPVLVDFWATWCGPCRMMAPIIDDLAVELEGQAVIAKLDIDVCPDIAARYEVLSVPTFIAFENGQEKTREVGGRPKDTLIAMIS